MALWGNTDTEADKPKYLNDTDKENTILASAEDVAITAGYTQGWNLVNTRSVIGGTRTQVECLVSLSETFPDPDADPDTDPDTGPE